MVALGVPEAVVDRLEVVDVDVGEGEVALMALGTLDLA